MVAWCCCSGGDPCLGFVVVRWWSFRFLVVFVFVELDDVLFVFAVVFLMFQEARRGIIEPRQMSNIVTRSEFQREA